MKNKFRKDWGRITHIVLYGYGLVGKSCLVKMQKDFIIDYVIDNAVSTSEEDVSLEIVPLEEGIKRREAQKIIVMTGGRVYQEILVSLQMCGLKEYEDFCSIEEFITIWYWEYQKKNCIMELHTALTMRCTLKCKNCNMFVGYYDREVTYSANVILEELNRLFELVDTVFCLTFLGGEPFLYKDLNQVLKRIKEDYIEQIGSIKIVTNGTIMPNDDFCKLAKDLPLWISISDYTDQVPYQGRLKEVADKLQFYKIHYEISSEKRWCDFGFPEKHIFFEPENCPEHRRACSPIFHGYNDGKLYFCHAAWSAEKIGKFHLQKKDYIRLNDISFEERHRLAEHCFGEIEDGYVSFCQFCGGCGSDNQQLVVAGEQMRCLDEEAEKA